MNGFNIDGHYDENGDWQRDKYCFIDCGSRCTCKPPNGVWHIEPESKEKEDEE